jgi:hypothetical protein
MISGPSGYLAGLPEKGERGRKKEKERQQAQALVKPTPAIA